MINLNNQQIKKTIPKVKAGLEKYLWLQNELKKSDVSKDRSFQKRFNGFYRVRRGLSWQKEFYYLLENNKNKNVLFKDILSKLHIKTGKMEASFASKLVATINPEMPIIDSLVLKNIKLKLPYSKAKNRKLLIDNLYQKIITEFSRYFETSSYKYLAKEFIKEYPNANITKTKMLDLILWQTRD